MNNSPSKFIQKKSLLKGRKRDFQVLPLRPLCPEAVRASFFDILNTKVRNASVREDDVLPPRFTQRQIINFFLHTMESLILAQDER